MASILNVDQIRNAAGTTALTIDSSGRIVTPARPAFSVTQIEASGNAGQTGHYSFNTVDTNINSCWNTSNNRFEAPVAGVYNFSFTGSAARNSSGTVLFDNENCHLKLEKSTDSGSNWTAICNSYVYFASANGSVHLNMALSGTFTLSNGDYVRINVANNYIHSSTLANERSPTFSGYLIG